MSRERDLLNKPLQNKSNVLDKTSDEVSVFRYHHNDYEIEVNKNWFIPIFVQLVKQS